MSTLSEKTILITGASRGIGKAIALRAAQDGANIVVAAKTASPHPKLKGTIYSVAEEIEAKGGHVLACQVDVRDETSIKNAVAQAVNQFGGIDVLVNNASAVSLTGTLDTPLKRFDLMHQVNTRGTFAASQACIPHLKRAANPHILNISPPINLNVRWFGPHVAYTIAKYGMSMCVLGMAEELKTDGIAVNALWPRTIIATDALRVIGGEALFKRSRSPEIMADAAYLVLTRKSRTCTGNFFIDEDVLGSAGITDLEKYAFSPGHGLQEDFFL